MIDAVVEGVTDVEPVPLEVPGGVTVDERVLVADCERVREGVIGTGSVAAFADDMRERMPPAIAPPLGVTVQLEPSFR